MLRVLVIDDEPLIRKDIEALTAKHPGVVVVGTCGTVKEGAILINATKPDLVLLDVQLTDGTGFDLLQSLKTINFHVIFITAYNEYAIKAIKYGALDYLLKPLDEDELNEALAKVKSSPAITNIEESLKVAGNYSGNNYPEKRSKLALRSQQYLQIVSFDEILYCHSDKGYTTFFLTNNRKVLVSKYIKEYEDLLPPEIFLRPHQSYLVNFNYIDRFHKDGYLILHSGAEIPVSTRKKDYVISFLTGEEISKNPE